MSEPTPESKLPDQAEPSDGSALWALLVGGAILVVAALLIFWPGGDIAGGGAGKQQQGASGNQASHSVSAGGGVSGGGLGVRAREIDPAMGRANGRVTPGLLPEGQAGISMAPSRPPKPEPTSFPSAAAEIEHYEKKLLVARDELDKRELFSERMQKIKEEARTPQAQDAAEQRARVVEQNLNTAKKKVEELEQKIATLKKKQQENRGL